MQKKDVIAHFGSYTAVAEKLDTSVPAISKWPETIPKGRACELHLLTDGALEYKPEDYKK